MLFFGFSFVVNVQSQSPEAKKRKKVVTQDNNNKQQEKSQQTTANTVSTSALNSRVGKIKRDNFRELGFSLPISSCHVLFFCRRY
jgi:hypothetical protein